MTLRRGLARLVGAVMHSADRLVPKADLLVVRTVPDFDDQGSEFVSAWCASYDVPVVWLVDDPDPALVPAGVHRVVSQYRQRLRIVPIRSVRGYWAYLRARVVVHTTGTHDPHTRSATKLFVNLWHGMPLKRLRTDAPAGRHQTDLLFATSPIHARHFEETWDLGPDTVVVSGLPRNDALLRASTRALPSTLAAMTRGRPLVVWMPTFRASVGKVARTDGHDYGNVFQMPDLEVRAVAAEFDRLGLHVLVKPHPSAPAPEPVDLPGLTLWRDEEVRRSGLSLYEILGHSRCLLTDHSSVWVDYLLLQRPIVFTIADLEAYSGSRGHYFTPLEEYLPGPVATSLSGLSALLEKLDELDRSWAPSRADALALHHTHVDAGSAQRAVRVTAERAGLVSGRARAPAGPRSRHNGRSRPRSG